MRQIGWEKCFLITTLTATILHVESIQYAPKVREGPVAHTRIEHVNIVMILLWKSFLNEGVVGA